MKVKRSQQLSTLLALFCLLFASGWTGCKKSNLTLKKHPEAVKSNNAFALSLYQQLLETKSEHNLFFSPTSINTALHMTLAGARGKTAQEMEKALHVALPEAQRHKALQALNAQLLAQASHGDIKLSIANRLWGDHKLSIAAPFQQIMTQQYMAPMQRVDFVNKSKEARQEINRWVEQQTHQKIKELIPPNLLKATTRLVLVNAIYFKGDWASRFKKKDTQQAPFFVTATKKEMIPMMHQEAKFKYGQVDGHQLLELPYKGKGLSMLLLLPKPKTSLRALGSSLSSSLLNKWRKQMYSNKVKVFLPRFKITSMLRLDSSLKQLGMRQVFSRTDADLSGITAKKTKDLYISAVVHKAFLEVNEKGTEAAAATAVVAATKSAPMRTIFRADRPFLLMLQENHTGNILFLGHVHNPKR